MDTEKQEVTYREDDGEYRIYCSVCDKFCIERYYENHLKSGTHINNIHKRQQLDKSFQVISLI